MQSNSHVSVYVGLLMAGCQIILVSPKFNKEYEIFLPIEAEDLKKALEEHPDTYAVYLTSPNQEGMVCKYE